VNFVDPSGMVKDVIIWDNNTVRILYEDSWIWHIRIQIWYEIFTFWAKWNFAESRRDWILSLFILWWLKWEVWTIHISDYLIEWWKEVNYYDLNVSNQQKDRLYDYIKSVRDGEFSYSLLWENCSTSVYNSLYISWIENNIITAWKILPSNFNNYLLNKSTDENFISSFWTYITPTEWSNEQLELINKIEDKTWTNMNWEKNYFFNK